METINEYKKRIKHADFEACYFLGQIYEKGIGIKKNLKAAFKMYQYGSKYNNAKCRYMRGVFSIKGIGTKKDDVAGRMAIEISLEQLLSEAHDGDRISQYMVGEIYYRGYINRVGTDYDLAFQMFEKAALQELPEAQSALAICYYQGRGVKKDYNKTFELVQKAANQGHPKAFSDLGDCYSQGIGVSQDLEKAHYWMLKAAELGNSTGQHKLGNYYYHGKGVRQDYQKAVFWFDLAAKQGVQMVINDLGACYQRGFGVKKTIIKRSNYFV